MTHGSDDSVSTPELPPLDISITGQQLLNTPLLNKSTAFSTAERLEFGLLSLLPNHVSALDEQLERTYKNYLEQPNDLAKHMYLASLHDRNETLFYALLQRHISEMTPIIYTPTVGLACQLYSHLYRRPRGLYISYPQREHLGAMLKSVADQDIRVIVVTDGERILGLGDLGIGGIGISIGKLALYSLCAGVHPATTLPIVLDVGTNNQELLEDPLYLGWRHERVRGANYDAFIAAFVEAVQATFPQVILQWEDFAKNNAARLLEQYRDQLCSFNDDIQGTGAVTLAGLLAATDVIGVPLTQQRIVILGAGSAATGIADQIVTAMHEAGMSLAAARSTIWLIDSRGLVHTGRSDLEPAKQVYAQAVEQVTAWGQADINRIPLRTVVEQVHPTVLIGTAAQPGAFDEETVRTMAAHTERPVIFPLSNPTSKSEARPADLLAWTDGRALVATGSPFAPVTINGRTVRIGQCNNVFIFPGVGLGIIASGARRVTDSMFVAAARALSAYAPMRNDPAAPLYPGLEEVRAVSRHVASAVAQVAVAEGIALALSHTAIEDRISTIMWEPRYRDYRRV
jgi:malate dehydrogenase (oxaloacetate-decarboxylating)